MCHLVLICVNSLGHDFFTCRMRVMNGLTSVVTFNFKILCFLVSFPLWKNSERIHLAFYLFFKKSEYRAFSHSIHFYQWKWIWLLFLLRKRGLYYGKCCLSWSANCWNKAVAWATHVLWVFQWIVHRGNGSYGWSDSGDECKKARQVKILVVIRKKSLIFSTV